MSISDERLALAEEVIQRWAQWIVHVSEDMEEPEWPTASANSVANDRDFVLSVLQSFRAAAKVRANSEGDGEWVMVPRIETDEMCEAGLEALRENLGHSSVIMRDAAACYRAMVHCASTIPATGGEKE